MNLSDFFRRHQPLSNEERADLVDALLINMQEAASAEALRVVVDVIDLVRQARVDQDDDNFMLQPAALYEAVDIPLDDGLCFHQFTMAQALTWFEGMTMADVEDGPLHTTFMETVSLLVGYHLGMRRGSGETPPSAKEVGEARRHLRRVGMGRRPDLNRERRRRRR